MSLSSGFSRLQEVAYLVLRVVSGFLMMQSGAVIVFGWFGGMPGGAKFHLMSQTGIGGLVEFVGGLAVMLGFCTRCFALVLSGTMAVAYFQFHQPHGTWPLQNQGLPAVLFSFIFLYIFAAGAGPWSVDGRMFGTGRR